MVIEMVTSLWEGNKPMLTRNITSRFLSTTLLLLLVSSLSVTALPCVCSGHCESGQARQDLDASGADTCDVPADQVNASSQCASASSDAPVTTKISTACDCDSSTGPELVRFQQQRQDWLTSSLDINVNPNADLDRSDRRTECLIRRLHTPTEPTSIPSYIRHASLLL